MRDAAGEWIPRLAMERGTYVHISELEAAEARAAFLEKELVAANHEGNWDKAKAALARVEELETEREKWRADAIAHAEEVVRYADKQTARADELEAWSNLAAHKIRKWGQGMTDADWREALALLVDFPGGER